MGGGGSGAVGAASVSWRWGGIGQGGGAPVPGRESLPASTEASAPTAERTRALSVRGPLVLVAGDKDLTRERREVAVMMERVAVMDQTRR